MSPFITVAAASGFIQSEWVNSIRAVVAVIRLCCAVTPQITTTMLEQTEERGRQAVRQVALLPAQRLDRQRAPMVLITRVTESTLPLLAPKPPKRNTQCTREGSPPFQALWVPAVDLATSPAAPQDRAPITSIVKAMGRERRVSTRTRGEQVDTLTALPTQVRWQGGLEAARTTAMKVS